MGITILKLLWFILFISGGIISALAGVSLFVDKINFTPWVEIIGINEITRLSKFPMIDTYGFYGGMFFFLIFLIAFIKTSRAGRQNRTEDDYSTIAVGHADIETKVETRTQVEQTRTGAVADIEPVADRDISNTAPTARTEEGQQELDPLSNPQLQTKAINLAADMRSFEADYHSNRDDSANNLPENATKEQWSEVLQNVNKRIEQRQANFSSDFKSKFLPVAVAIRHEIVKRLDNSLTSDNPNPALDHGILLGSNPLSDAADHIEGLAKKLA